MPGSPVLKYRPADFLVRENLVLGLTDEADADQHYLLLRKCGYTTMESVRIIAEELRISPHEVSYAGLKDEDGITEQIISVPHRGAPKMQDDILLAGGTGTLGDRWIKLRSYGFGTDRIGIGKLEGNGFRIVVRNLTAGTAKQLAVARKFNFSFLNYYDGQRFGVPGGPKLTHHVGAAILAEDWQRAREYLVRLKAPESPIAETWTGSARDLFDHLDARTTAFYLSAHGSHQFNADLRDLVDQVCPGRWSAVDLEGLTYHYLGSVRDTVSVMAAEQDLPYRRYSYTDGAARHRSSTRPTVVQTVVSVGHTAEDAELPGTWHATLGLFLPSGCYATAALRQLFALSATP
ncbi:tRNA pseudouridine(13) synthase TruD [Streptomyces chartreusis]|uniref:tRNA pseudouridine(13) synthase TruD n=1 Tax=Streptomyces chartreusis TaxID=1969 RepID=UPI0033B01D5E